MFGRGVFLKGKNFDSIVIVVPLHVSKFYRVLKKSTAYCQNAAVKRSFQKAAAVGKLMTAAIAR
jgi:hypothetical protein